MAAITMRKLEREKTERLKLSWQTRSLAMVMAASGGNANEEIMSFAANLTIDNEEYEQFHKQAPTPIKQSKLPIHATTQEQATQENFDKAADRNNFDMLALFGQGMSTAPPGQ